MKSKSNKKLGKKITPEKIVLIELNRQRQKIAKILKVLIFIHV